MSVTLDRVWINLAADPTQSVSAQSTAPSDTDTIPGQVRGYANGRQRIVTSKGASRQIGRTLNQISDADLGTLRSWRGQVVCFRDARGRRLFGTYFAVSTVDYKDGTHDAAITFVTSTYEDAL